MNATKPNLSYLYFFVMIGAFLRLSLGVTGQTSRVKKLIPSILDNDVNYSEMDSHLYDIFFDEMLLKEGGEGNFMFENYFYLIFKHEMKNNDIKSCNKITSWFSDLRDIRWEKFFPMDKLKRECIDYIQKEGEEKYLFAPFPVTVNRMSHQIEFVNCQQLIDSFLKLAEPIDEQMKLLIKKMESDCVHRFGWTSQPPVYQIETLPYSYDL